MPTSMIVIAMLAAMAVPATGSAQRGAHINVKREKREQEREVKGKTCKTYDGKYIKCPATNATPNNPSAVSTGQPSTAADEKAPDGA